MYAMRRFRFTLSIFSSASAEFFLFTRNYLMAIVTTPAFAASGSLGFGSGPVSTTGNIGTGDFICFCFYAGGSSSEAYPATTFSAGGVSGSVLYTQWAGSGSYQNIAVGIAQNVATASGTISFNNSSLWTGGMGAWAMAGVLITGESFSSITVAAESLWVIQQDPQTASATIPTSGVGIAFIGGYGGTGTADPTTWASPFTGSSTLESQTTALNGASVSGAICTTSGSQTASATGTGDDWDYGAGALVFLTVQQASSAPAVFASIAIPRKMFLKPKRPFVLR
jgi:hypothetical protein